MISKPAESSRDSWTLKRPVETVLTAVAGAAMLAACGSSKPNNSVAQKLQERVLADQPVSYDANHGVVSDDETTVVPLTAVVKGRTEWFKLTGTGTHLKVVEITKPDAIVGEEWTNDPSVNATSHEGIVDTLTADGVPGTHIRLSDGQDRFVAVGQTSANTDD